MNIKKFQSQCLKLYIIIFYILLLGTFGVEIVYNVWCLFNDSYIMVFVDRFVVFHCNVLWPLLHSSNSWFCI